MAEAASQDLIEWTGGDCPVADGTRCQLTFRDGGVFTDSRPESWIWGHYGTGSDIIAYRVAST